MEDGYECDNKTWDDYIVTGCFMIMKTFGYSLEYVMGMYLSTYFILFNELKNEADAEAKAYEDAKNKK